MKLEFELKFCSKSNMFENDKSMVFLSQEEILTALLEQRSVELSVHVQLQQQQQRRRQVSDKLRDEAYTWR